MKMKKIALTIAIASSATLANANNVEIDSGVHETLEVLAAVENGTALNLAINTNSVDASVNTSGGFNSLNGVGDGIAVETSAIGAVNTGNIDLEQGNASGSGASTFAANLYAQGSTWDESTSWWPPSSTSVGSEGYISAGVDAASNYDYSTTLSNYSAANIAYNSGFINASVNTHGHENYINGIKTSAIGAVQTGNISVTVK